MKSYKLFVGDFCPYCKRVEQFLETNDINIETVNINKQRDQMKELIEKGGKRQIPCLLRDGEYIYESLDIIDILRKDFNK